MAVALANFTSVLEVAFALNAVVSVIQESKRRGGRELLNSVGRAFQEYPPAQAGGQSSSQNLVQRSASKYRTALNLIANTSSALTLTSSFTALGLLILNGFAPTEQFSALDMSLLLLALLGTPALTMAATYAGATLFQRRLASLIEECIPDWESEGLHKEGAIRLTILAQRFRGLQVFEDSSDSHWSRIRAVIRRLVSRLRGYSSSSLEGPTAEQLQQLAAKIGKPPTETLQSALGFMYFLSERLDHYTVLRSKDGKEKKVLNRDLVAAIREGRDPFEDAGQAHIPGE